MSILSKKENKSNSSWEDLLAFANEEEEIKHDAQILMYRFLSEIEKYQDLKEINKKTLSQKIKTSASYITQLFRGIKPLNFETIAKIQKVLKINFQITASPVNVTSISINVNKITTPPATDFAEILTSNKSYLFPIIGGQFNENLNSKENLQRQA